MFMKTTLRYFFKPTENELDVPVTTTFPKGKKVWNIGENNPYINDGYVILCNDDESCTVIPSSLEFLYVGNVDTAYILHEAAGSLPVSVDNLNNMRNYDNEWHKGVVYRAAEIVEKFMDR